MFVFGAHSSYLFEQAFDSGLCVIFIDEIDAVGGRRYNGFYIPVNDSEQTLNQIIIRNGWF